MVQPVEVVIQGKDQASGALNSAGESASKMGDAVANAAAKVAPALADVISAVDAKTAAIKSGLQVEQSEIELQRQHLAASQAEQQARLQAAQAKGDDAAATRARNALAQIEADQLGLVARAKRAEAAATQQATAARREELVAVGPLTAAHAQELQAAENYARALRVEAAAADQAAQRTRDLGSAHRSAAGTTDQLSGRIGNLTQLLGQMAGALGAAFTFRELVTAAAQMEQLRSGLTAVTGDATKAGQELEFVRKVAIRIGADVTEVGKAFLGLSAATKGTAVEGEPTRQVFESVATAMGKAGKSSAETANALQALAQMASKGVVQSEELRGQLGEALPGALNAAAKGLGITTADLMKLVEEGKIAASDLFPALAKGLDDLYGGAPSAQTLSQEITNIKNSFTEMAANIGDSGGLSALKVGAEVAQGAIVSLDATVVAAGKSIGTVIAAVANRDFSGLKQAFVDIQKEAQDKLLKAAQHNDTLRAAIKASGDQGAIAALAQQDLAAKTQQAGSAAAAGASDFIKLQNGYRLVVESVREQIAEQEKSLIARDAEGKASIALAQAFGTEAQQRAAVVVATANSAAEQEKMARLKLTELATLQEELKALKASAAQMAVIDDIKKKQIADLEKQIGLRQQDADKAVAQAQAGRLAAEQAKAEAEAYKDNSARVNELREAYDRAKAKLEEVRAAKAVGKATTEEVTKAELEAGKAALIYRDALQDQLRAIEAKRNLQVAEIDVQSSTLRLAIEQQRAIAEVARARGDERTAIAAQNEIRRLEIELLRLTAQAKRAEADAALASAEAKKAELIAADQYNGAKKLEIEAAIKAAEVKRLEGDIAEVTANKLRNLAQAQGDVKASSESATGSIQSQAAAMERLAAGVERVGQGYRNKDGFTSDALGKAETQGIWTRAAIVDYLKQAGLDELLARNLSEQFLDSNGDVPYEAGDVQKKWAGKFGTLSEALGKMAEYYRFDDAGQLEANALLEFERKRRSSPQLGQSGPVSPSSSSASSGTSSTSQPRTNAAEATNLTARSGGGNGTTGNGGGLSANSGGATYISNITIPGLADRQEISFADPISQARNEDLLRKLARAKSTAIR